MSKENVSVLEFIKSVRPKNIGRMLNYLRPFSFVNLLFYFFIIVSFVLVVFFSNSIFFNGAKNAVSYVALLASSLTMLTLIYNVRRHLSEDYSKDAKEYLKRAYEIMEPKEGNEYPPDDRMVWLTAARFLKISERLGRQIIMSSHKKIFIEEKQFWRWKMGGIIKNFPSDYYAQTPEKFIVYGAGDKEPLSEYSLYVIYKFIEWDDNYTDPLDNTRFSEDDINMLMRRRHTNLFHLLKAVKKIRENR